MTIWSIYCKDLLQGTLELLEAAGLKALVRPGMRVSLKPNLVMAKPPGLGATTHCEIAEGLIMYLRGLGIDDISVIESAWVGGDTEQAFDVCGYRALREKYGVALHDLKKDATTPARAGKYTFDVCRKALDTDFLINLPVLKAHCQTKLTCCLKNLKGCIPDSEKRRFHAIGLHEPIAHLARAIPVHFNVVDAVCGDLSMEEGGNPAQRNMLMAGSDMLLLDTYGAELIGLRSNEVDYLRIASGMGIGRAYEPGVTAVTRLREDAKPRVAPARGGLAESLSAYVNEDRACSACHAALLFALRHVKPRGKINVGQGFRGKPGTLGCGDCAAGCARYVPGCPPTAEAIRSFLETCR
ncbi:MAG: DUF362 domain-containing protein [Oscillospiraceae bacterium]|nr:DUF362 domain-containing protein [Oscillospiraceae bacterium]